MIYLDRNENNYGPAPACYEALRSAGPADLSAYSRDYSRGVKSPLSERLGTLFGVDEGRVLLGYGGEDLLKQSIHSYLGAQEKLLVPAHSWWYYKSIAAEVGGLTLEYPILRESDRFRFDVEATLEECRRVKPAVVLLSSPNNPTGNSLARHDIEALLGGTGDAMVILDEAYFFGGPSRDAGALVEQFPHLLVIRTFSKYYALAGLRIGFGLMGKNWSRLAESLNRYLGYNRLSEKVALAALDAEAYYQEVARKIELDKRLYYGAFAGFPGCTIYRSDAHFLLAALPPPACPSLDRFLTARGLKIKCMSEPHLQAHVRITVGTQAENQACLAALREFFAAGGGTG
jgi:histidinol-phosphate aminotransferase